MNLASIWQTATDTAGTWRQARALERPGPRVQATPARHRLALLAWALPPNTNAGVFRPLSFLQYGPTQGWDIDAFHGEAPANQRQHGEELLARVPPSVRLHQVRTSGRQPAWRFTPQVDGGFVDALDYAEQAIRVLKDRPPSVVLASGPPFFVFVAARFVARHFGAKLVLDYRDEWSECPFDFVSKGPDDRAWERRCLADAHAVLFTTQSHLQHQVRTFAELKPERAHLVPNGWEAADFSPDGAPAPLAQPSGIVRLAHVGNLAGHTPPHDLLRDLAALLQARPAWRDSLRLQLIGRRSPAADEAIRRFPFPQVLDVVDHVSKREANTRMQMADALVLIAVPDLQRYLPGKLFDYIAARRPVLVHGAAGEASDVVQRLGIGQLVQADPVATPDTLERQLQQLVTTSMTDAADAVNTFLAEHRRDVLAARAFALFGQLQP